MSRMLETEEAARRLGVKPATLYAYVSRGLLASHRAPDLRRSLFDAEEVERLARRSRPGRGTETRLASVTTSVTQLHEESGPAYRGRPATSLALTSAYEEVAELLWGADPAPWRPWSAPALDPPAGLAAADRLRWVVVMAGAGDPLRADHRPDAVRGAARRLIATMACAPAPPVGAAGAAPALRLTDGRDRPGALSALMAARLCPEATVDIVRAVNAVLVLLADHELATSTVAVRVAASTRADLYDAVMAGLSTVAGPLHGGASLLAFRFLLDGARLGPRRAVDETLRWHTHLPGFGHAVYRHGDGRFPVLREVFESLASEEQRHVLGTLVELAGSHGVPLPNVDLGLAAMMWATGMAEDAGHTLFSVARVAGWTAHYLEELDERPLRFRARAVYAIRR